MSKPINMATGGNVYATLSGQIKQLMHMEI